PAGPAAAAAPPVRDGGGGGLAGDAIAAEVAVGVAGFGRQRVAVPGVHHGQDRVVSGHAAPAHHHDDGRRGGAGAGCRGAAHGRAGRGAGGARLPRGAECAGAGGVLGEL
ncbi:hypothetical protein LTR53_018530, partial [Teratosphaeriaceae sp. CCFEE 6253]